MAYPNERTVRLVDGTEVSNYSPEWLHECLATHLLNSMPLLRRRAFLDTIKEKQGEPAYMRLRNTLVAVHAARKPPVIVTD
jgi:hypothetical protein